MIYATPLIDQRLSLAISPCPNDTMIFGAWINGLLQNATPPTVNFDDIQTLNERARLGSDDVIKVSFNAAGHVLQEYRLLRSGGALGRGCGPLVVAAQKIEREALQHLPVAIPGELTTAALLLRLWNPGLTNVVSMPFHEIMPAVKAGKAAAGVIIHESRFTYQQHGLRSLVDLGEWWETETRAPIPLGGIIIRRSLGVEVAERVDQTIRASLEVAQRSPELVSEFISSHAQEMDPKVQRQHIELYVNSFSLNYGEEGERAIRLLFERAVQEGLFSEQALSLLFQE